MKIISMNLTFITAVVNVLFNSNAIAGESKILIGVYSGPGYVSREDEYQKNCMIDESGILKYQFFKEPFKIPTIEKSSQLTVQELENLQLFITEIRLDAAQFPEQEKNTDYETGYGDLPDFSIGINPSLDDNTPADPTSLLVRGDGYDLALHSSASRELEKELGRLCGMTDEFREIRELLEEISHN